MTRVISNFRRRRWPMVSHCWLVVGFLFQVLLSGTSRSAWAFAFSPRRPMPMPRPLLTPHSSENTCTLRASSCQRAKRRSNNDDDNYDNAMDEPAALTALRALSDFHDGTWDCPSGAQSFTVTADTAAGIVQRKTSPPYKSYVKVGRQRDRDLTLSETFSWECSGNGSGGNDNNNNDDNNTNATTVAVRHVSLQSSNVDVDDVDGSYSFDETMFTDLPATLTGSASLVQWAMEHCVAVSDDCRARCWVLYGMDGSLLRVVTSQEHRVVVDDDDATTSSSQPQPQGLTATDLLEMQSDVDRLVEKITGGEASSASSSTTSPEDRMEQLTSRLSSSSSSTTSSTKDDGSIDLTLHTMSLLEVSSGVWLGDIIIRDHPNVATTLEQRGRGFGTLLSSSSRSGSSNNNKDSNANGSRNAQQQQQQRPSTGFAEWSMGVQKMAWRWMWNFGPEIRAVTDVGKAMGAALVLYNNNGSSSSSLAGTVCVNQGLSRRIRPEERMVYIDWPSDESVSFVTGPFSIHVPRYLTFDRNTNNGSGNSQQRRPPLSTEFGVYQSAPSSASPQESSSDDDDDVASLPKLVCSKISRVYNYEGLLKQGCTSFFQFKRFGTEKDDV